MNDKARAAVLAMFSGDSLSLGVHWIYDVEAIRAKHGRVETLLAPQTDYHAGKTAGEFTHYGDQALVLLESLAACRTFDLDDFFTRWKELFKDYSGYLDMATRKTLAGIENGKGPETCGSPSNDIAGASRIAPLLLVFPGNPDGLERAARAHTRMTHTDEATVDTAAFFARVTACVLAGATPVSAIETIAGLEPFAYSPIAMWVEQGMSSISRPSLQAIVGFGQSCHTPEAFSGIVHLITAFQDDLKEALIQSVMAGGDSAARAMMVGMVLGAHLGMDAIPKAWVQGLKKHAEIVSLIDHALNG